MAEVNPDNPLLGTPENDSEFVATDLDDIIHGLAGDDIIFSSIGNDRIYGNQPRRTALQDGTPPPLDNNEQQLPTQANDETELAAVFMAADTDTVAYLGTRNSYIIESYMAYDPYLDVTVRFVKVVDHYDNPSYDGPERRDGTDEGTDILRGIEVLRFSDGADGTIDVLVDNLPLVDEVSDSTPLADNLSGFRGSDRIDGQAGDDIIIGDGGNDFLTGGAGDDRIYGHLRDGAATNPNEEDTAVYAGNRDDYDIYSYAIETEDRSEPVTLIVVQDSTNGGSDGVDEGRDELHDIHMLRFADGEVAASDLLNPFGGFTDDDDTTFVISGTDDDEIEGGDGDDFLEGDSGSDILTGGAGDDQIYGHQWGDERPPEADEDIAVYLGNRDDYTITTIMTEHPGRSGLTATVVIEDAEDGGTDGADEGRDELYDIDILRFADTDYPVNFAPLVTNEQRWQETGLEIDIDASRDFSDADGDTLAFSATLAVQSDIAFVAGDALDTIGLTLDSSGRLTGTLEGLGEDNAQVANLIVTADDGNGGTASQILTVDAYASYRPPNQPPVASRPQADLTADINEHIRIDLTEIFSDPDADDSLLVFDAVGLPEGLAFAADEYGVITGKAAASATHDVFLTATDQDDDSVNDSFTIRITETTHVNNAPQAAPIPLLDRTVHTDSPITLIHAGSTFTDRDSNDQLGFTATVGDPAQPLADIGLALRSDGAIHGTVTEAGSHDITVTATDLDGAATTQTFTLTAMAAPADTPNARPVMLAPVPDRTLTTNTAIAPIDIKPAFHDPDGGTLIYQAFVGRPDVADTAEHISDWQPLASIGLELDQRTGIIGSGESGITIAADTEIILMVSDGEAAALDSNVDNSADGDVLPTFTISANNAPAISESPLEDITLALNAAITPIDISQAFTDPDGDETLTFGVDGLTGTGLEFDAETNMISGAFTGTTSTAVTVTASDPHAARAQDDFTITIGEDANTAPDYDEANALPQIARTAGPAAAFAPIETAASFSDADADARLTYAAYVGRTDMPDTLDDRDNWAALGTVGLQIDPDTGIITTLDTGETGQSSYLATQGTEIIVVATDQWGAIALDETASEAATPPAFVIEPNTPPEPSPDYPIRPQYYYGAPAVIRPIDLTRHFVDAESEDLTFSVTGIEGSGLEFADNIISGTLDDTTEILIGITATDEHGASHTHETFIAFREYLYGSERPDQLVGNSVDSILSGFGGDDRLDGGGGNDTIAGGMGRDTLTGGTGDDSLAGDEGNDMLVGGPGNDMLEGGPGNDTLHGHTEADGGPAEDIDKALFTGRFHDYRFEFENSDPDGLVVIGRHTGLDVLRDIDQLVFAPENSRSDISRTIDTADIHLVTDASARGSDGIDVFVIDPDRVDGTFELAGGGGGDIFQFLAVSDSNDSNLRNIEIVDFNPGQGDQLLLDPALGTSFTYSAEDRRLVANDTDFTLTIRNGHDALQPDVADLTAIDADNWDALRSGLSRGQPVQAATDMPTELTVTTGQATRINLADYFANPEADEAVTYFADGLPAGMTVADTSIIGAAASPAEQHTVTITAQDAGHHSASQTLTLTVIEPTANQPPRAAGPLLDDGTLAPRQVATGSDILPIDVSALFADPDGDTLTYTATVTTVLADGTTPPEQVDQPLADIGLSLDAGMISGTIPDANDALVHNIAITAADEAGNSLVQTQTVRPVDQTGNEENAAPVLLAPIPDRIATIDAPFAPIDLKPLFNDAENDALTYEAFIGRLDQADHSGDADSWQSLASAGLQIDAATGLITEMEAGLLATSDFEIVARVTDRQADPAVIALDTFAATETTDPQQMPLPALRVDINQPPVIDRADLPDLIFYSTYPYTSGGTLLFTEPLSFGDALSWQVEGFEGPSLEGLEFDETTGVLNVDNFVRDDILVRHDRVATITATPRDPLANHTEHVFFADPYLYYYFQSEPLQPIDVGAAITDPDAGDIVTYEVSVEEDRLDFDAETGLIDHNFDVFFDSRETAITVTARDMHGGEAQHTFEVGRINELPRDNDRYFDPFLPLEDVSIFVGQNFEKVNRVNVYKAFEDPDAPYTTLNFRLDSPEDSGVVLWPRGLTGVVTAREPFDITVTAIDVRGGEYSKTITVEVTPDLHAITGRFLEPVYLAGIFPDLDGEQYYFSVQGIENTGLTDPVSRSRFSRFEGTLTATESFEVTATAFEQLGERKNRDLDPVIDTFTFTVDVMPPPIIDGGSFSVDAGSLFAPDIRTDTDSFRVEGLDNTGLAYGDGTISGDIAATEPFDVSVIALDDQGSELATNTIRVDLNFMNVRSGQPLLRNLDPIQLIYDSRLDADGTRFDFEFLNSLTVSVDGLEDTGLVFDTPRFYSGPVISGEFTATESFTFTVAATTPESEVHFYAYTVQVETPAPETDNQPSSSALAFPLADSPEAIMDSGNERITDFVAGEAMLFHDGMTASRAAAHDDSGFTTFAAASNSEMSMPGMITFIDGGDYLFP